MGRTRRMGSGRRRAGSSTYLATAAFAAGALTAGLIVPLAAGEAVTSTADALSVGGAPLSATGGLSAPRGSAAGATATGAGTASTGSAANPSSDDPAQPSSLGANGPSGATGSRGAPRASEQLFASDRGVTAKTIKLGFTIMDLKGVQETGLLGDISFIDAEEMWRAYVDDLNARGGINGRRIEPFYEKYNVLDVDDMRRACNALTEDHKVFAVFDNYGFSRDPVLCIAAQHDTPFFESEAVAGPYHRRAPNRIFTPSMSRSRILTNEVMYLQQRSFLRGRSIAVINNDYPGEGESVQEGMVNPLKRLGYDVNHRVFSKDLQTMAGQVPVAVSQMKAAGIDTVFTPLNFAAAAMFVREAENQRWYPQYLASDFSGGGWDSYGKNMPQSWDGAISVTSTVTADAEAGILERPHDRRCRTVYEKTTRKKTAPTTDMYSQLLSGCALLDLFELGATRAGADLTRDTLATALKSAGEVPRAGFANGLFVDGKTDAANYLKTLTWDFKGCGCWTRTSGYIRALV